MGGIAGIVHFRGDPPRDEHIQAMSVAVAHRGPDDAGVWSQGPAAMAQRRMALTHAGRRQPIEDDPLTLVLDGRVYELSALLESLRREGVEPATTGDADIVLSAWKLWGADVVRRLEGDFALAVWDRRDRVMWLARDPVGVKPLYFAQKGEKFAFASDVRALLLLPWVSRDIAPEEIAEYLSFRYTHAPRTLLRDVQQLPAGCFARVDVAGLNVQRWFVAHYPPPDAEVTDEDSVRTQLEASLGRAVDRRLIADQPLGIMLSGGTASSAITAFAAERVKVSTYNVSFADEGVDEAAYAGRIANLLKAEHHLVRIGREDFVNAVVPVAEALGQPIPSPAAIPQYLVCQAARQDVRILLSGDGGDELLGGVRVESLPTELRLDAATRHLPPMARRIAEQLLRRAGLEPPRGGPTQSYGLSRGIGGSNVFDVQSRAGVLRDPAHVRPGMRRTMLEPFYNELRTDPINEVLQVYFRGWLPEDSLLRSDRVSMAAGVEVRYPLLDTDVVTLCQSWSGRAKVKRWRGRWQAKWPLKQLLEARGLPAQLVWRPKRGLPSPMNRWLRGEGEGFLWERIEEVCADPLGLFRADAIRTMARQHARGEADWGPRLWTLIFFDLWRRRLS